jgi:hypothetical protein
MIPQVLLFKNTHYERHKYIIKVIPAKTAHTNICNKSTTTVLLCVLLKQEHIKSLVEKDVVFTVLFKVEQKTC